MANIVPQPKLHVPQLPKVVLIHRCFSIIYLFDFRNNKNPRRSQLQYLLFEFVKIKIRFLFEFSLIDIITESFT